MHVSPPPPPPSPRSQLRVLIVISVMMERMGRHIQPHIAALLQCLPQLWTDSAQENSSMLRIGILNALTNIVRGLGSVSAQLHDFILPVVQLATDVKSVRVRRIEKEREKGIVSQS